MRYRRVLALPVLLSALTGCGASATPAGPSSGGGLSGTLHGRVVDGLTATGLGGIRVSGGLQNVLSEASGDFALNPAFETEQGGLYTFSGSAIVERNTALRSAGAAAVVSLIPASFDLRAFNEMFRPLQLQRWREAPPLRLEMRTGKFADINALDVTMLENKMSDGDKDALVADLTWALPQLTGNTFTAFASVTPQTSDPDTTVSAMNVGIITVVRLKGLTIGTGFWGYSRWRFLSDGTISGGLVMLDEDFELSLHPRRRALRAHELGHALGMGHVTARVSIMNSNISVFEPNDFDKQAARIAFQRPPGNRAPDTDPAGYSTNSTAPGGAGRWSGPVR